MSRNYQCTNDGCACRPNNAILCTVTTCAHHCKDNNYCGLPAIQVGTHEADPKVKQCTDCQNFMQY